MPPPHAPIDRPENCAGGAAQRGAARRSILPVPQFAPPGRALIYPAARPCPMARNQTDLAAYPSPFLKWAGGKRRLLPDILAAFPAEFGRYYEPFLGGGATLLHMLSERRGTACLASDSNPELISTYEAIRDGVEGVIRLMEEHAARYDTGPKEYYYAVRDDEPSGRDERAARMLFLNRTCFNGLYRVNSRGKFNVPFGGRLRLNLVNAAKLRAASALLSSPDLSIACADFEDAVAGASAGDLVYFDPPYQPVSATSFTHYAQADFGGGDFARLAAMCRDLDRMGCHVLLSNSDTPEVRRQFVGEHWRYRRLAVNRMINADAANRTGHHELLIRNF